MHLAKILHKSLLEFWHQNAIGQFSTANEKEERQSTHIVQNDYQTIYLPMHYLQWCAYQNGQTPFHEANGLFLT